MIRLDSEMNRSASPPSDDRPLSVAEQVNFLLRRGITIQNRDEVERILGHISFHRLRGYWEPLHSLTGAGDGGIAFAEVIERYNFDQGLRNLLMDAFDHIEVSLRTRWAYVLSHTNGGGRFAHRNAALFGKHHGKDLDALNVVYSKYAGKKYRYTFDECPIWVIVEVMSFGLLAKWYSNTIRPARLAIASHYGVPENILVSLLAHLRVIRNMCAHHEQLWDRTLVSPFKLPDRLGGSQAVRRLFNESARGKIYNAIVMIAWLMSIINPHARWHRRLASLLNEYPDIPPGRMGFPPDWPQRITALGLSFLR